MFKSLTALALSWIVLSAAVSAQQGAPNPVSPQSAPRPISSPEPLTMLALAGGAAAAGGLAFRRKNKK